MDKGRLEENNESFDIIEENNESFYPSLIFEFSFIEAFVLKRKKIKWFSLFMDGC